MIPRRDLRAYVRVPVEMPRSFFVNEEHGGLAEVVAKRRPPHDGVGRGCLDGVRRVLEHVVAMVGAFLVESDARDDLGKRYGNDLMRLKEGPGNVRSEKEPFELACDSFHRHARQQPFRSLHGGERAWFDREPELRGEPARAQDAQRIFGEPLVGVAHHADDAALEIALPRRTDRAGCGLGGRRSR